MTGSYLLAIYLGMDETKAKEFICSVTGKACKCSDRSACDERQRERELLELKQRMVQIIIDQGDDS